MAKEREVPTKYDAVTFDVSIQFTETLLGSSPANPEIYAEFIQTKAREAGVEGNLADEVETLSVDKREVAGWSVFHSDENGLFFFDYKIRGFLKEAASSVTGKEIVAYRSKIDKWVFVGPRKIYLKDSDGEFIKKEAGVLERPLRAMTAQGPRVSLKRSDFLGAGTKCEFEVTVLPLGVPEFTEQRLRDWFAYGKFQGFGEWRNASYGRFDSTVSKK